MFYIIQVCCTDCDKYKSFKICPISDYTKFIRNNYNEYEEFSYYIYDSFSICVDIITFDDFYSRNLHRKKV